MKKVSLILVALIGFYGTAQKAEHHRGSMKDLTPEQAATLHTKKMVLELDLSDKQQEQVYSLNLENATLRKEKKAEWKSKKENPEAKKPTDEERFSMKNARLDHQIAMQEKMKQILDENQYAEWKQMRQHAHKKSMHRGKKKMHQKKK